MYLNYFAKIRAHQLCCYPYTSTSAVRCVWIFCRPQVWRRTEHQFWSSFGWAPVRACKLGSESSITIEKISFWSGWSTWDQHLVLIAYIETGFHEQILLRKWRLQPSTSKMLMGFYPSNVKIDWAQINYKIRPTRHLHTGVDSKQVIYLPLPLKYRTIIVQQWNNQGRNQTPFQIGGKFQEQIHGDIEV